MGFQGFQFQGSQDMLVCKCGKVSDWFTIAPLCFLWPKPSVSNVIVNGQDLSEVTLCNMLNLINFYMDLKLVFRTSQYAIMWLPLHS